MVRGVKRTSRATNEMIRLDDRHMLAKRRASEGNESENDTETRDVTDSNNAYNETWDEERI